MNLALLGNDITVISTSDPLNIIDKAYWNGHLEASLL